MTVLDVAHALRKHPVFGGTSLRHLSDLAELAREDQQLLPAGRITTMKPAAFIVVLSGNAFAATKLAATRLSLSVGDVLWTLAVKGTSAVPMAPSAMSAMTAAPAQTFVPIEDVEDITMTAGAQDALVLPLTRGKLENAGRISMSFATSVDLKPVGGEGSLFTFLETGR